jgi:hypothetical protein
MTPEEKARKPHALDGYLVHQPGVNVAWSWWWICGCDLYDDPDHTQWGKLPPHRHASEKTHEFICFALNPKRFNGSEPPDGWDATDEQGDPTETNDHGVCESCLVTADTITDEQIRALRASLPAAPEFGGFDWQRARECEWALSKGAGFVVDAARDDLEQRRALARARCAEILNRRTGEDHERTSRCSRTDSRGAISRRIRGPADPPTRVGRNILTPQEFVHQETLADNDQANEILRLFVKAVCDGHTAADSDFRSRNIRMFEATAQHFREGKHTSGD